MGGTCPNQAFRALCDPGVNTSNQNKGVKC